MDGGDEIGEVREKGETNSDKEREETYSEVEKEQESEIIKEAKDDDVREKLGEESDDSKWGKIDWSDETLSEREGSKWNEIDWSKGDKDEQENKSKWNEIDWSKEKNDQSEDKNEEYAENAEEEGEYENIGSQSTVLIPEKPKIEGEYQEESEEYVQEEQEEEYLENEEEVVEIDPEEYENDQDPIIDTEEIEFVRDMEELGRMLKEYDEKLGYSEEENDNTAFNAEQAYREIKERKINKEEKEKAQELEEQEKEITEEQKEEHIEEILSGDAQEEDVNDTSEEAEIEPEEFDYLWEKYEQYEQEGKSSEEINNLMQEAEETYKMLKEAEKVYEQQEKDKLKLVDHEDEEDLEDGREEIDQRDVIEFFIETEEELYQQKRSQEEIDEQMEKIANDYYQKEQEKNPQIEQEKEIIKEIKNVPKEIDETNFEIEEKKKVEQTITHYDERPIEVNSEAEEEVLEESGSDLEDNVKSVSPQESIKESFKESEGEELEEDEYEKLKRLYHQETRRNPIYAKIETKGFKQWLEEQDLKIKEVEEKEGEEKEWKKKLKKWIEESREAEINTELKQILKEILQDFSKYEEFEELLRKYKNAKLTEKEREKLDFIINKFLNKYPIHLQLYYNLSGFKAYFQEQHWWNPWLIREIKYKFLNHLSKKYEILKFMFDENVQSNKSATKILKKGRVKVTDQEKALIRKEFLVGIPIQRIMEIINNYNEKFEDDFIEILQSYYNEMITKNARNLSLGVRRIDKIVNGFENMIYLDRSISKDSIKKIELLINREIQVIKNWRKPRRERISGVRIKITDEGIKTIKDELKSGIPIQRLSGIVNDYGAEDNFIQYIKQMLKNALDSHEKEVRTPLTMMGQFITNWQNILYRGYVISESDFNKLKLLIGKENPITHKIVYGRRNLEAVKLIKNETHAELIGVFIVRGSIRTDRNDLYISYNGDDHPDYIYHLEKLITKVFGRPPSIMSTRDRFYISGPDVTQYLANQMLSNENRNVPSWIKKSSSWIHENLDEWKVKYLPLVIACLKGMINGSGSIGVASKQDRIEIYLTKSNRSILRDFQEMCNSLGIRTSKIKKQIRENGRIVYYIYIISRDQVRRFLIDIVKPKKWECIKDSIQQLLNARGTSIEVVLEMTPEFKDLRRKLFQHQKQQYTFRYNPTRIVNIKNNILRDRYYNYIKNISLELFPSHQFEVKTNIRPSKLKFIGEHIKEKSGRTLYREVIKTQFIKEHLINNNPNIEIFYYNDLPDGFYKNLLDIVRQVYDTYRNKNLGRPWHEPILKKIMVNLPNALASEIPVWKKLNRVEYYVGHVDLNLVDNDTFFVADLKDDETDIIKSLIQITSYGINQKHIFFNKIPDFNAIDFKCIAFTKDELWVFDPESLKHDIIRFIKYANNIRTRNLKSLPFSKGLKRTDLLEDIEKVMNFFEKFIKEEENNDLDDNIL